METRLGVNYTQKELLPTVMVVEPYDSSQTLNSSVYNQGHQRNQELGPPRGFGDHEVEPKTSEAIRKCLQLRPSDKLKNIP